MSIAVALAERLRSEQDFAEAAVAAVGERLRLQREAAAQLRVEQAAAEVEHAAAQAVVERLRAEREAADTTVEQLRAEQEAVEAAAAVAAVAERLRLEEEVAYHTQRLEEARAQLDTSGVPPPPAAAASAPSPAPHDEETLCVLCLDAPKDHIIIPCGHQCVCEACAEKLKKARHPLCPFCRTPINSTFKVFVV
jgi:hypothetical protein